MLDGQPLTIDPKMVSPRESCHRADHRTPPYFLQPSGPGVHTGKDTGAWWEASLSEPVFPDSLRYLNRRDKWGVRSQQIRVDVQEADGDWTEVYNSASVAYRQQTVERLAAIGGPDFPVWTPQHDEDAVRWHDDAVHAIRAALDYEPNQMSPADWLSVAALIPTRAHSGRTESPLGGNEWRVLAHGLLNQVRRDPRARSGIASFGGVLNTRSSLRRLSEEIKTISERNDSKIHTISRHGVTPLGVLHSQRSEFLAAVKDMLGDLNAAGSRGMLAYGTLLGAVREGRFIEHDDDVDLFYTVVVSESESKDDAINRILNTLELRGWRISKIPKYMNVHVSRPGSPISLDLFPLDLSGSTVQVHMESMHIRQLPSAWFDQSTERTIHGLALPVPAHSEEFLEERYGSSWRIPDPFHDWGWTLVN